ncbi:hypothetical protein [Arsenophonus endosymbiont of Aleurodicus floccissimus]|nr:hypothetical protein [Arsenophonus endosymbiont of Aleurodicus floccissimus]
MVITPDVDGTIEKVTYSHPACYRCYDGMEISGLDSDFLLG